jgi:hypothetical protein
MRGKECTGSGETVEYYGYRRIGITTQSTGKEPLFGVNM